MADPIRQAEEARVINDARAFATRRVESTIRHLRKAARKFPREYQPMNAAEQIEQKQRPTAIAAPQTDRDAPTDNSAKPRPASPEQGRRKPSALDHDERRAEPIDAVEQATPAAQPETVEPKRSAPASPFDSNDTEVLEEITTVLAEIATASLAQPSVEEPAEPVVDEPVRPVPGARRGEPVVDEPVRAVPGARRAEPPVDEAVTVRHPQPLVAPESDPDRLQGLLQFVARQEPGLRWAVGNRENGTTVLVTDLAHGWIPPGITLPAGVRLLGPERRTGNAAALLGQTTLSVTYAPGDSLGWATDYDVPDTSSQPQELPPVDDVGWALSEATHWRDGLPRMVHTLAKAGAAGTGVVDVELDVLRVHLEIARYHLMAQY
ncbi:MAG: DUF5632 domain-containing protein, partial [Mycobacterium sp.]